MTFTAIMPALAAVCFVGLFAAARRRPKKGTPDDAPEDDLLEWAMTVSERPLPATVAAKPSSSWLQSAAFSMLGATIGEALVAPSLRVADAMTVRLDSVSNLLTGLGTAVDKGQAGRPDLMRIPLQLRELTTLYRFNGYAARFVDIVADDATRKGWQVTSDDADDGVDIMQGENKRLGVVGKVGDALRWARLYGGSGLMIVTSDAATRSNKPDALAQPLDLDTVEAVHNIVVLDGSELQPLEYETDPRSPFFRQPITWLVTPSGRAVQSSFVSATVHATRIIYFPGRVLPPSLRFLSATGLDESVLEAVWNQVRNLTTTDQGAAILAQELKVDTLKVSGLANLATSDQQAEFFNTKLKGLLASQSMLNMRVLDSGDEYTSEAANVTGYRDLSEGLRTALASVTAVPQTILFGEAPGGLNSDGDSSRTIWDKVIAVVQTKILLDRLERVYEILFAAKAGPTDGSMPDEWAVNFNPLDEPTEAEQAANRKLIGETDAIYIAAQVYTPEHVAESRFGDKGYQTELLPVTVDDTDEGFAALERARAELAAPTELPDVEPTDEPTEDEPLAEADIEPGTGPAATAATAAGVDVQKTALNGAQVTAAAGLVASVAEGALPRDAVLGMLQVFFNLSDAEAQQVLGSVGASFEPEAEPAAVPTVVPPAPVDE